MQYPLRRYLGECLSLSREDRQGVLCPRRLKGKRCTGCRNKMLQIFKRHQTTSLRGQLRDPGRATVFMHIPKACGTAVRLGLLEALAPRRELLVHDRVMFGSFNGFESFEAETRRSICLNPAGLDRNADFVTGHISFSTLAARYPDAQFLTVLREPFSRIISHWLFWQNFSGERLSAYGEYASLSPPKPGSADRVSIMSRCRLSN